MEDQSTLTRHLTPQELDSYRQRMMPAADLLIVNDHLASCEECYNRFYPKNLLASTYSSVRLDLDAARNEDLEHLSFDQILAHVDNELEGLEREIAGTHIEICSECNDVARDIRQFKADLALGKVYAPESRLTFWDRIAAFWQSPAYRIPVKAFALGMVVAVMLWFVTSSLRREIAQLQAQVARVQQENDAIRSGAPAIAALQAQLEQYREENRRLQDVTQSLRLELKAQAPFNNRSNGAATLQVAINDGGGRVTLDERRGVEGLNFLSPDHRQAVSDALRTGRVEAGADLAMLIGKVGPLMGGPEQKAFALVSPVAVTVAQARPTFKWSSLGENFTYTVTVYRDDIKREVASSQSLTGTEWTSPPLERGHVYFWQVRAIRASNSNDEIVSPSAGAPEAKFSVLSQSQVDELDRLRRRYSNSHLTLGVLYARKGLFNEAGSEFQTLLRANPNSLIVQQLLNSVVNRPKQKF
jgi:hypothetical protein